MDKTGIIRLIQDYEAGRLSLENALASLQAWTGKEIDAATLDHYWRYQSLEELVEDLLLPPLLEVEAMDENMAMSLLREIFDNLDNDAIRNRNCGALERRFRKPSGAVAQWIFQDGFDAPHILNLLQTDTTWKF